MEGGIILYLNCFLQHAHSDLSGWLFRGEGGWGEWRSNIREEGRRFVAAKPRQRCMERDEVGNTRRDGVCRCHSHATRAMLQLKKGPGFFGGHKPRRQQLEEAPVVAAGSFKGTHDARDELKEQGGGDAACGLQGEEATRWKRV